MRRRGRSIHFNEKKMSMLVFRSPQLLFHNLQGLLPFLEGKWWKAQRLSARHIDKPAKNMNPYSQNNVFLSDGIPRCFNLKAIPWSRHQISYGGHRCNTVPLEPPAKSFNKCTSYCEFALLVLKYPVCISRRTKGNWHELSQCGSQGHYLLWTI